MCAIANHSAVQVTEAAAPFDLLALWLELLLGEADVVFIASSGADVIELLRFEPIADADWPLECVVCDTVEEDRPELELELDKSPESSDVAEAILLSFPAACCNARDTVPGIIQVFAPTLEHNEIAKLVALLTSSPLH